MSPGGHARIRRPFAPRRAVASATGELERDIRAVAARIPLSGDGKAPEWLMLMPAGPTVKARSGREWKLSEPARVIAASLDSGVQLPLDIEHGQYHKAKRGERADAVAWIAAMEVRDGAIWGRVEWLDEGRQLVESKKYRYISPDFAARPGSAEVAVIYGAGLVNRPDLAMPAIIARRDSSQGGDMSESLKRVLAALGLPESKSEDEAVAAVRALGAERDRAVAARDADPPLDRFVPRADHDAALQRATAAEERLQRLAEAEVDAELDRAVASGRITPATRDYHRAQALTEGGLERLKRFVAAAPEIAPRAPSPGGDPPNSGSATAGELRVAKLFRRDEAFLDRHAPRREG